MSVLIDNIGTLVTNDPELGDGPLGLIEDAALVLGDGRRRVGRAARRDARGRRGRALRRRRPRRDPGLRRLATRHLVFAGDRARGVRRPDGGPRRTRAGGIRTTVAATRAATDERARRQPRPARRRGAALGHDHDRDASPATA